MLSQRAQTNSRWSEQQHDHQLRLQQGSKFVLGLDPIDVTTTEDWLIRDELLALCSEAAVRGSTAHQSSYSSGLGGTADFLGRAAAFFNHFFQPTRPVMSDNIVIGTGSSAMLATLIHDICDQGEGLLVDLPMWNETHSSQPRQIQPPAHEGEEVGWPVCFEMSCILCNEVRLVPGLMAEQICDPQVCVAQLRDAVRGAGCKVRGLLFRNPPTSCGQPYGSEYIKALLRFCEEEDLHLISDETYALSILSREPSSSRFTSVLELDLERLGVMAGCVHVFYDISKSFGSTGLRMVIPSVATLLIDADRLQGFVITQTNHVLRRLLSFSNSTTFSTASLATTALLFSNVEKLDALLRVNRVRLKEAADVVMGFATYYKIAFYRPVAGVYIWLRLGGTLGITKEEEKELEAKCASNGVSIGTGCDCSDRQSGWFRLTFALPRQLLVDALCRIETSLGLRELSSKYSSRNCNE